jgi:two-component system sensor histidine kinase AtoS
MRDVINRPLQSFWGGKSNKVDVVGIVQAMLDHVPEPGIVFDIQQNKLLHANSPFLILTAYSLREITNAAITDLFENIDQSGLLSGEELQAMLKLRNRPSLPVVVRAHLIENGMQWHIIKMVPRTEHLRSTRQYQDALFEAVKSILSQIREGDLDSTIAKVIDVSHSLFETNLICHYQADNEFPELIKKVCTDESNVFPDKLPSTDLVKLANPQIWMPGKRVVTELHKAARIAELSFIASTPIGQENALTGLLVIGGMDDQPPSMILPAMEVLSTSIALAFEHTISNKNYEAEISTQYKLHSIHNAIYEYVFEGVIVLSPDLTIEELNPSAELMLGYTKSEVTGQSVENILITPDRVMPILASAAKGVATPNLETVTLHHRDGKAFSTILKIIPILEAGEVIAINFFIRDVSESERIRTQTHQLEQRALLGEFMGVFAHEVINPINSISTGLQLLSMKLDDDSPLMEIISRMENDVTRLHHQMEALKNFAKPYEPLQEPVNLGDLIVRIVERWRPKMSRVGISQVVQIPSDLPKVKGDIRALEQVFTNLITNAIDAMSTNGGTLSVLAETSALITNLPQVMISISDNGPGIPEEIRGKIFEPFVTTKATGTGLGLPITKRIVTAHRGNIQLNSFPGGTVFHVYLPACEDDPECQ